MIQIRLVLLGLAVIGGIGLAVYNHYRQQEEPQAHQYGPRRRRRSSSVDSSLSRYPESSSASQKSAGTTASQRSGNDECTICLSHVGKRRSRSLKCGHIFHDHCIKVWLDQKNDTCPNCRAWVL